MPLARDDLRIDQHQRLIAPLAHVDDQQPLADVHLRRRQADARRGIHRLEHVVDERAQRRIHLRDGLGTRTQARIGKFQNLKQCHGGNQVIRTIHGPRAVSRPRQTENHVA